MHTSLPHSNRRRQSPKVAVVVLIVLFLAFQFFSSNTQTTSTQDDPYVSGAWFALHGSDGYLSDRAAKQMAHLKDVGFNWVAYAPEPSMKDVTKPVIEDDTNREEHRKVIRKLKAEGLKVLLFPRIESPTFFRKENPLWRGDIKMETQADWDTFHDRFAEILGTYASLAEEENVEGLCLGLEYMHSTTGHPDAWRKIIGRVRKLYSGKVTYSANWYQEYEQVTFWDALDCIGVGAYFPVAEKALASRASMRHEWEKILSRLKGLSMQFGRPVVFTEVGYPSFDQAGWKPWEWTTHEGKTIHPAHQADCFRSFFDAIADENWFHGYFVWRYHTDTRYIKDWEYCPQGREAEIVIKGAIRDRRAKSR